MGNQWEPSADQQDISPEEIPLHTPALGTTADEACVPFANGVNGCKNRNESTKAAT